MLLKGTIIALFMILAQTPTALFGTGSSDSPDQLQVDGWTKIFQKAGVTVASKYLPDLSLKAYRAKGILNAPIEQILEVLADTPKSTDWIPDLSYIKMITKISVVENITHSVYAVPFPFKDREFILHNQLRLDRDQSALVAEAVSIDHIDIPLHGSRVRARMVRGQTWLRPLFANRTAVEFILSIDLRGSMPEFLAAMGMTKAPYKFVKALESQAQRSSYPLRPAYRDLLRQLDKMN